MPNGAKFSRCLHPTAAIESFSRRAITTFGRPRPLQAYEKYTRRPLHYSFDYQQAHFTILDNSRSDELPAAEFSYLQKDLELHKNQPVKFIVSHRPSWILNAVLGNPGFPLHQLAKRYGVKYVIAGHIHQMLHFEVEGVTYLSMPSAGGHLRLEKQYDKGWFFAHTLVSIAATRRVLKSRKPRHRTDNRVPVN